MVSWIFSNSTKSNKCCQDFSALGTCCSRQTRMICNYNADCMQTVILQNMKTTQSLTNCDYLLCHVIAVNLPHPRRRTNWNLSHLQRITNFELVVSEWMMLAFLHPICNHVLQFLLRSPSHPLSSWEDICLQRLAMRHLPLYTLWHILHMLQEAGAKLHWWVIKNSSQSYYYLLHFQLSAAADYTA